MHRSIQRGSFAYDAMESVLPRVSEGVHAYSCMLTRICVCGAVVCVWGGGGFPAQRPPFAIDSNSPVAGQFVEEGGGSGTSMNALQLRTLF
jgi:hypothetical protein